MLSAFFALTFASTAIMKAAWSAMSSLHKLTTQKGVVHYAVSPKFPLAPIFPRCDGMFDSSPSQCLYIMDERLTDDVKLVRYRLSVFWLIEFPIILFYGAMKWITGSEGRQHTRKLPIFVEKTMARDSCFRHNNFHVVNVLHLHAEKCNLVHASCASVRTRVD